MYLLAKQRKEITGIYKGLVKTILYNRKGIIKAVIPPNQKQPTAEQKTIRLNCFKYELVFNHPKKNC